MEGGLINSTGLEPRHTSTCATAVPLSWPPDVHIDEDLSQKCLIWTHRSHRQTCCHSFSVHSSVVCLTRPPSFPSTETISGFSEQHTDQLKVQMLTQVLCPRILKDVTFRYESSAEDFCSFLDYWSNRQRLQISDLQTSCPAAGL